MSAAAATQARDATRVICEVSFRAMAALRSRVAFSAFSTLTISVNTTAGLDVELYGAE